ncbi:MAG: serine hydrolase [Idiomarinaceae bacterium]|nr:serine hydrolase [Idiomarinaceae bacterium]|tara:strand:- start:613 stop:2094 length:1482 start_codon:yes stop_codon:yes gene_type:complete
MIFHKQSIRRLLLLMTAFALSVSAAEEFRDPVDHTPLIERFENELKPRYGTTSEAPPKWSLQERMAFHKVPALSIAVAIDGKLAWAKAYGQTEKDKGQPVDTKTLFQAASLSKPIASLAALKLVSTGKIELDSPVNDALQSWKLPENEFTRKNPVTLRHLLSHRAGTTIHGFRGYLPSDDIPTSKQIVKGEDPANTDAVVVNQTPGSGYRYSGGGFQVVQLLLEDLTQMSFAKWVNRSVFEPLSLSRSNFEYPQLDENSATGHVGAGSNAIPGSGLIYPELAAAGLWTTPTELVTIGTTLAEDRSGANILIPQDLVKQLIPESAREAGLGFGLNNDGDGVAFVHNGHNPGFSARWINYADGRASVAVLTNSDSGGLLIREVLSALGHIYGWQQDAYLERETIALSKEWTQVVEGEYYIDHSSDEPGATIWVENNKLWIEGLLTDRTRLYPISSRDFFIESGLNMTLVNDDEDLPNVLDVEGEVQLIRKKRYEP